MLPYEPRDDIDIGITIDDILGDGFILFREKLLKKFNLGELEEK